MSNALNEKDYKNVIWALAEKVEHLKKVSSAKEHDNNKKYLEDEIESVELTLQKFENALISYKRVMNNIK